MTHLEHISVAFVLFIILPIAILTQNNTPTKAHQPPAPAYTITAPNADNTDPHHF